MSYHVQQHLNSHLSKGLLQVSTRLIEVLRYVVTLLHGEYYAFSIVHWVQVQVTRFSSYYTQSCISIQMQKKPDLSVYSVRQLWLYHLICLNKDCLSDKWIEGSGELDTIIASHKDSELGEVPGFNLQVKLEEQVKQ